MPGAPHPRTGRNPHPDPEESASVGFWEGKGESDAAAGQRFAPPRWVYEARAMYSAPELEAADAAYRRGWDREHERLARTYYEDLEHRLRVAREAFDGATPADAAE